MKKILLCVLIVLLTACQKDVDVLSEVKDVVENFKSSDYTRETNHTKKYYDYYVPRDASLYESSGTYSIFLNNKNKILMSVDISKIINDKHYRSNAAVSITSTYGFEDLIYQTKDIHDKSIFEIEIYQYADHYLINLNMNNANLSAMVKSNYVAETLDNMLLIATNVEVRKDVVIDDFYSKGSIDYKKDPVDLFEIIVPTDGRLDALIESEFENSEEIAE